MLDMTFMLHVAVSHLLTLVAWSLPLRSLSRRLRPAMESLSTMLGRVKVKPMHPGDDFGALFCLPGREEWTLRPLGNGREA